MALPRDHANLILILIDYRCAEDLKCASCHTRVSETLQFIPFNRAVCLVNFAGSRGVSAAT